MHLSFLSAIKLIQNQQLSSKISTISFLQPAVLTTLSSPWWQVKFSDASITDRDRRLARKVRDLDQIVRSKEKGLRDWVNDYGGNINELFLFHQIYLDKLKVSAKHCFVYMSVFVALCTKKLLHILINICHLDGFKFGNSIFMSS